MPLTKEQEEKLRAEFREMVIMPIAKNDDGTFTVKDVDPKIAESISSHWLSKINEALEAQRKEIVEGIKSFEQKPSTPDPYNNDGEYEYARGSHDVIQNILSLPQLTGKQEENEN